MKDINPSILANGIFILQDCELRSSCTYEVIDCSEIVVDSSLVRAESVQTPKQCFVNGQTSSRVSLT